MSTDHFHWVVGDNGLEFALGTGVIGFSHEAGDTTPNELFGVAAHTGPGIPLAQLFKYFIGAKVA